MVAALVQELVGVLKDVAPIVALLAAFQVFVFRRPIPHLSRVLRGIAYIVVGMAFFIEGLEVGIFPLGERIAQMLVEQASLDRHFGWAYAFGFLIGFSTTIAEPALLAVAMKAEEVSAGAIAPWPLRVAVALGVGIGVALGCYRIVAGHSIVAYIVGAYVLALLLTLRAPKEIIPIAYDSGGVTTSTVTVPLVAALGIGLASAIPGRSALADGFGLIAFASVFPILTVLLYGILASAAAEKGG